MNDRIPIPQSLPDFSGMFPTERACELYLERIKWPEGWKCRKCHGTKGWWIAKRRRYDCSNCGKSTYLTAGTVMDHSHMPLRIWFHGAFLVSTLTPGISAVQFQRQMGIKRYETAFQMLHKLRHMTVNLERTKLSGTVEVDDTYVGGLREGARGGRSIEYKTVVVGAVEVHPTKKGGERAGRIRFKVVGNAGKAALEGFVQSHVEPGTTVHTDGWHGYERLFQFGYAHQPTIIGEAREGAERLRLIHLEISNLKTFLRGTYHGRVERQHLQAYCNEFCFRHNRRFYAPALGFLRMLQTGTKRRGPRYKEMYGADEYGRNVHPNGHNVLAPPSSSLVEKSRQGAVRRGRELRQRFGPGQPHRRPPR